MHRPSPPLTAPHRPASALTAPHRPASALTAPHLPCRSSCRTSGTARPSLKRRQSARGAARQKWPGSMDRAQRGPGSQCLARAATHRSKSLPAGAVLPSRPGRRESPHWFHAKRGCGGAIVPAQGRRPLSPFGPLGGRTSSSSSPRCAHTSSTWRARTARAPRSSCRRRSSRCYGRRANGRSRRTAEAAPV